MRSDINGAFDEMVEALEENEDMVECKECFDLFPKADCEKSAVGFICPTCKGRKVMPTRPAFEDPFDCYTQDFPEVSDYDPDSVVEYEVEPSLGDALDDLIKDEYDAINGYEIADEKIQHTPIPEDDKDEILDTLDHIKEEEEEHIDELKELCPECETADKELDEKLLHPGDELPYTPTPGYKVYYVHCDFERELGYFELPEGEDPDAAVTNYFSDSYPAEDIYVDECDPSELEDLVIGDFINDPQCSLTEALTEAEEAEDSEEVPENEEVSEEQPEEDENEEVSDLDSAYEAALEVANDKGVGQVFGYATEEDESFVAIDLFDVDDAEAVEDDLRAVYDNVKYAYVAYPEKTLEEALFEGTQLTEAPGLKSLFTKENRNLDSVFGSYIVAVINGGKTESWEVQGFRKAEKLAVATSKNYPSGVVYIYGGKVPAENYDQLSGEIAKLCSPDKITNIATYRRGKATLSIADKLNQAIKNAKHFLKAETKFGNKIPSEEEKQQLAELEAQLNANLENATDGKVDAEDEKEIAAKAKEETSEENTSKETSEEDTSEETTETGTEEEATETSSSIESKTEDEDTSKTEDEGTPESTPDEGTPESEESEESEELPEGDNSPIAAQTYETADKIFNSTYTVAIIAEGKASKRDGMIGLKTAINQAINDSERNAKAKVYVIGAAVKPEEYEEIDGAALNNKLKELKLWKRKAPIFAKKTPSATVNACYTENGPVLLTVYQNGQRILEKKEDNLTLLQMNIKAIDKIIAMGKAEDGLEDDNAQAKSDASKDSKGPKDSAETTGVDKEKAEANLKKIFKSIKTIFGQKSSDLSKVLTDDMILQIFTSATGTTPTTKKDVIIKRVRQGLKGVQTSAFESDMFAETLCETLNEIKDEVLTESDELLGTGDALQNAAKAIGRMTSGAKAVVGTMK